MALRNELEAAAKQSPEPAATAAAAVTATTSAGAIAKVTSYKHEYIKEIDRSREIYRPQGSRERERCCTSRLAHSRSQACDHAQHDRSRHVRTHGYICECSQVGSGNPQTSWIMDMVVRNREWEID